MALDFSWGAPFTEENVAERPDDGHRYELIDGALFVTPAPSSRHQDCVGSIYAVLRAARRPEHKVIFAPFDVRLSSTTVIQPDVIVARRADVGEARLESPPLLAVEVLSHSTRWIDIGTKRLVYEAAGVPAFWLVDPDVPSLTVLELEDGRYVERATVAGEEPFHATIPFAVTIVPARLLED